MTIEDINNLIKLAKERAKITPSPGRYPIGRPHRSNESFSNFVEAPPSLLLVLNLRFARLLSVQGQCHHWLGSRS